MASSISCPQKATILTDLWHMLWEDWNNISHTVMSHNIMTMSRLQFLINGNDGHIGNCMIIYIFVLCNYDTAIIHDFTPLFSLVILTQNMFWSEGEIFVIWQGQIFIMLLHVKDLLWYINVRETRRAITRHRNIGTKTQIEDKRNKK